MNKKQLIYNSLDIIHLKKQLKNKVIFNAILFFMLFFVFIWILPIKILRFIIICSILYLCINIPIFIHKIINLISILRNSDRYVFSHTVLSNPLYLILGKFYFSVNVQDETGNIHTGETSAIYTTIKNPYLEEWKDKKVLAAYDPETQKVFVIGLKKDFPDIPEN